MTTYKQIMKKQKALEAKKKAECVHDDLEMRTVYRRCKCCGVFKPFADPEWIKEHGLEGRGHWYDESTQFV